MIRNPLRRWLRSYFSPRRDDRQTPITRHTPPRPQLAVERLENRDVPSISIPLSATTWTPFGPAPIVSGTSPGTLPSSGRNEGIAIDPTNANRLFVAAASGGVWRTTDGAHTWTPLTDFLTGPGFTPATQTLDMGAIVLGHLGAGQPYNTIYAGEGEGDQGTIGHGILKSSDGGATWSLIGTAQFNFSNFHSIVVDPNNANTVYAAVEAGNVGIWRSLNGGTTWTDITSGSPVTGAVGSFTDVDMDPTNPNVIYASAGVTSGDAANAVYRTTNASSATPTWQLLLGGSTAFPGALPGNIQVAIAPSRASTLYVSVAERQDPTNGNSRLLGVYYSQNSGQTFVKLVNAPDYLHTQGEFDNVIAVSPTDPNTVYVAGQGVGGPNPAQGNQHVYVSHDAGQSWTDISVDATGNGPHTDSHASAFDSNGNWVLGSDGGVFQYNPTTGLWSSYNGDLPKLGQVAPTALNTIQQYGIALHPTSAELALGSAQDNGTERFVDSPTNPALGWINPNSGDGGRVIYNYDTPNVALYVSPINGVMFRTTDGGVTWTNVNTGLTNFTDGTKTNSLEIDPSRSQRWFYGTDVLNISEDGGQTWGSSYVYSPTVNVTIPTLPNSNIPRNMGGPFPITSVAVGRTGDAFNDPVFYVAQPGHDSSSPAVFGQLYRLTIFYPFNPAPKTTDWTIIDPPGATPGSPGFAFITKIVVDPADNNIMYVSESNGRVFRTDNADDPFNPVPTWTEITGAGASRIPAGLFITTGAGASMVLDPQINTDPNDDDLYAATSNGVYVLHDPGQADPNDPKHLPVWTRVGGNSLPSVQVDDVELNATTGILAAGTYGRGMWEIQTRGLIQGFEYNDLNGNGIRDAGEPGLAGVTVQLLDASNSDLLVATATTDATGHYEFRFVRPGNYDVRDIAPAGFIRTSTNAATLNGFTEQSQASIDFGNFQLVSISGTKFNDLNGNGTFDKGEPGLAGVKIDLFNSQTGAMIAQLTTGPNGTYSFTNLGPIQGTQNPNGSFNVIPYRVAEEVPAGFVQTAPATGTYTLTLTSGTPNANNDFGNFQLISISGHKYEDLNGNGKQDAGEPALQGFTFDLTNTATKAVVKAVSNAAGNYSFTGVGAGTYQITEEPFPGFLQSSATPAAFTATSGQNVTGEDFGNFRRVAFSINGFPNPTFSGVGHTFTVTVLDSLGNPDPAFTGTIHFTSSDPKATLPADYTFTGTGAGKDNGVHTFTATLVTVGPQSIAATEVVNGTAFTGSQTGIIVRVASGVIVSGYPDPTIVNAPHTFTVTVQDQFGAVADGYIGTVHFTSSDPQAVLPADYTFTGAGAGNDNGVHTFTATLVTTGSQSITATDTVSGVGGSQTVTVVPLIPTSYVVSGFPSPTVAGAAHSFTVTVLSQFGGTADTYTGTVHFTSTDPQAVLPADYTFTSGAGGDNGVHTFSATLKTAGTQSITATDTATSSVTGFEGGIVVGSSSPASLAATGGSGQKQRVGKTYGSPFQVLVKDAFGNPVPGVSVTFTAPASGPSGTFAGGGLTAVVTTDATGTAIAPAFTANALGSKFAVTATVAGLAPVSFSLLNLQPLYAVGADAGAAPYVAAYDATTGNLKFQLFAFDPAFRGGVRVAVADVNGDGVSDVICAAGPGGGPHVRVFNGVTGIQLPGAIGSFNAYDQAFTGGVFVAAADVNGDGFADVVTGAGAGAGPDVSVFDGQTGARIHEFFAQAPNFTGGVPVAAGDVNGDGFADVIAGAAAGGAPAVIIYNGNSTAAQLPKLSSFFAFSRTFTGGVWVGAGDVNGDGKAEVITGMGSGKGSTPDVRVFNGVSGAMLADILAFPATTIGPKGALVANTSGVRVAGFDFNGDGFADVIAGQGPGQPPKTRVFDGRNDVQLTEFNGVDPTFLGGVFVGGG